MSPARIAVIGSGIAGLASAWLLARHHHVTLFEANGRVGGHSNTVVVDDPEGPVGVDTGFIVFNEANYPHLSAMLSTLGVATQPTEMSFAVSVNRGHLEYSGTSLNGLFGQRSNLASATFHGMLLDIARFNRAARRLARADGDGDESLGAFLARLGLGDAMRDRYLLPMAAAIWSCPPRAMLDFPALGLARFFDNHGLLNLRDRPMWRTVTGGSRRYVDAITASYAAGICTARPVRQVVPVSEGVQVIDGSGHAETFAQVVVATHADEALSLLPADDARRDLLSRFAYQPNRAVLHRDEALMPVRRRVWSAWNYLSEGSRDDARVSVTYWMNCLQRLDRARQYFVSLNPVREPAPEHMVGEFLYEHPVFDAAAMAAQQQLPSVNGARGIWLAGSYFGYGFHEDALRSAVVVAGSMGVAAPWAEPASRGPSPEPTGSFAPAMLQPVTVPVDPSR